MSTPTQFVHALSVAELESAGAKTVQLNGHVVALFSYADRVYAIDNRCPHMGFPLDKGSVHDGILTCHWHHARFDLESGGTFDQFADDVPAFDTDIRDGEIYVDLSPKHDPRDHQRERLQVGLERDIPLVLGKAVLVLTEGSGDPVEPFRAGLEFGSRYRLAGWGQGLTMHVCFMNMRAKLNAADKPRALYHGLSAVARDTAGWSPRFPIRPLPGEPADTATLKGWLRQFIQVRDEEGAERCVISAIRGGATSTEMADMLFAAVTDFRYIDIGHPADFTNKAFEALDIAGWHVAEAVLTSLVRSYARAARMEESNAWRHPIDLIIILQDAFAQLPTIVTESSFATESDWQNEAALIDVLLADDPQAIARELLVALKNGCTIHQLAATVSYAAALRIARFHTSNEFGDWDTALHTFTFANAIQEGLKRAPSIELLRGVFDAAMSVYLDRFLNIPAARLPVPGRQAERDWLEQLTDLLNRQQQVNQAGSAVVQHLANNDADALLAKLGELLLREDRDFHTIQCVEAAFNQYEMRRGTDAGTHILVAAARYLAAHSPTVRAQGQTYQIARRLHHGDLLFEA